MVEILRLRDAVRFANNITPLRMTTPKIIAGEFAATVLLYQLGHTSRERSTVGLEPAPFEGTVTFTTGETAGAYFVRESAPSSSDPSCSAKPAPTRKPVFLRAGGTLIKSAICSSSQRFGTVRLV